MHELPYSMEMEIEITSHSVRRDARVKSEMVYLTVTLTLESLNNIFSETSSIQIRKSYDDESYGGGQ